MLMVQIAEGWGGMSHRLQGVQVQGAELGDNCSI